MSHVVKKVLVVLSDISERSASNDLEREMKPLLNFPCIFQVVSDTFIALSFTQKQYYDVIISPQNVEDPISITTFVQCLITADGFSPPFICLLEDHEEPRTFGKVKTEYVRYTSDGGIPIAALGVAISSALTEDITIAEAQIVSPRDGDGPSGRPVMTQAAIVSATSTCRTTEPAARPPPKRVRRQPSATAASASRPRPAGYPSYPMAPLGYPAPPMPYGAPPVGPEGQWQAMQWQAQMAFSQHQQHPHYAPPPRMAPPSMHVPPPGPHSRVPYAQPPLYHPGHGPAPAQPTHQAVPAPRAAYVPACPMSPTPKARPKKNRVSVITTITYGPPTHISVPIVRSTSSECVTDAALVLPVHKNHQPFHDAQHTLHTPDRSPPVIAPLTGRGRTAEVVYMELDDEDEGEDILRGTLRNTLSPGPVVDPDLLSSMFDDAR